MTLTDRLASDALPDRAYVWLCRQRRSWPDGADVWALRRDWTMEKARLQQELRSGTFRFGLLERIEGRIEKEDGGEIEVFAARDALVLKALAVLLEPVLPTSRRCVHVRGHGGEGGRASCRRSAPAAAVRDPDRRARYYAQVDPVKLVERLARFVPDPEILRLLAALTARTSERGGLFRDSGGLPLGCPLSPLLGAFFLAELDARLSATGLFFVRFMDDILVLAPTRWKLRRAVRIVNATLAQLGLEKHPDKTFSGRAAKGFDFLGYRRSPAGLSVAKQTRERCAECVARLQERERTGGASPGVLGQYVRRWQQWARAGLDGLVVTGWGVPGDLATAGAAAGSWYSAPSGASPPSRQQRESTGDQ